MYCIAALTNGEESMLASIAGSDTINEHKKHALVSQYYYHLYNETGEKTDRSKVPSVQEFLDAIYAGKETVGNKTYYNLQQVQGLAVVEEGGKFHVATAEEMITVTQTFGTRKEIGSNKYFRLGYGTSALTYDSKGNKVSNEEWNKATSHRLSMSEQIENSKNIGLGKKEEELSEGEKHQLEAKAISSYIPNFNNLLPATSGGQRKLEFAGYENDSKNPDITYLRMQYDDEIQVLAEIRNGATLSAIFTPKKGKELIDPEKQKELHQELIVSAVIYHNATREGDKKPDVNHLAEEFLKHLRDTEATSFYREDVAAFYLGHDFDPEKEEDVAALAQACIRTSDGHRLYKVAGQYNLFNAKGEGVPLDRINLPVNLMGLAFARVKGRFERKILLKNDKILYFDETGGYVLANKKANPVPFYDWIEQHPDDKLSTWSNDDQNASRSGKFIPVGYQGGVICTREDKRVDNFSELVKRIDYKVNTLVKKEDHSGLIDAGIEYHDDTHEYFIQKNGKKTPVNGVTSGILKWLFPNTYDRVSLANMKASASYGTNVHENIEMSSDIEDNKLTLKQTKDYKEFLKSNGFEVLAHEYLITNGNMASAIDLVFKDKDGNIYLGDIKTTSELHVPEVSAQLSVYAKMFEDQNPGLHVKGIYALSLQKPSVESTEAYNELVFMDNEFVGKMMEAYESRNSSNSEDIYKYADEFSNPANTQGKLNGRKEALPSITTKYQQHLNSVEAANFVNEVLTDPFQNRSFDSKEEREREYMDWISGNPSHITGDFITSDLPQRNYIVELINEEDEKKIKENLIKLKEAKDGQNDLFIDVIETFIKGKMKCLNREELKERIELVAESERRSEFNTPSVAEIEDVHRRIDPTKRHDRVKYVSRLFSDIVSGLIDARTEYLEETIKDLEEEIAKNEAEIKAEKTTAYKKTLLEDANRNLRLQVQRAKKEKNSPDRVKQMKCFGLEEIQKEMIAEVKRDINYENFLSNMIETYRAGKLDEVRERVEKHNENTGDDIDKEEFMSELEENKNDFDELIAKHDYIAGEYRKLLGGMGTDDPKSLVWKYIFSEACQDISDREGVKINSDGFVSKESLADSVDENYSIFDTASQSFKDEDKMDVEGREESGNTWDENVNEVSAHKSLSREVRRAISSIIKLDVNGEEARDDLNNAQYLDSRYVHAQLMIALMDMSSADQMIPKLQLMAKSKPWVANVIEKLEQDPQLESQFYKDFRKGFQNYWVQRKQWDKEGKGYKTTTVQINSREGSAALLDKWYYTIANHDVLNPSLSVYSEDGGIRPEVHLKLQTQIKDFSKIFETNGKIQDPQKLIDNMTSENASTLSSIMEAFGMEVSTEVLQVAFTTTSSAEKDDTVERFNSLLDTLTSMTSDIGKQGEKKMKANEFGVVDLTVEFKGYYTKISNMFKFVTDDAIESSVRQGDKMLYGHVVPNYLDKLLKRIRNVTDDNSFAAFMEEEYGQYSWFKSNGEWMSGWLELFNSEEEYGGKKLGKLIREGFKHKTLAMADDTEYNDWTMANYTRIMLEEYFSASLEKIGGKAWAWYHIPIMSDAPAAEFLRMVRFVTDNKSTYKQKLLPLYAKIIKQEFGRIQDFKLRARLISEGKLSEAAKIDNFDKNGGEFKFFPALNSYVMSDGKSFLDWLTDVASKNWDGTDVQATIHSIITDMMDREYQSSLLAWKKMGLFEKKGDKFINLPRGGEISINITAAEGIANRLESIKGRRSDIWTKEMEQLYLQLKDGVIYGTQEEKDLLASIATTIANSKKTPEDIKDKDAILDKLKKWKSNITGLEEYLWNSQYASSQIVQLTTGDYAFYKNPTDFQKRFKEIHSPGLRMNTMSARALAMLEDPRRGGKCVERSVYLSDCEITSAIRSQLESVFLEKYHRGEVTADIAAHALALYGCWNKEVKNKKGKSEKIYELGGVKFRTKEVNVADAQAFRSINAYRDILDMMGDYSDEARDALDRIVSGKFTSEDFEYFFNTKKPFVFSNEKYTYTYEEDGVMKTKTMKVPVQHKNSEFLLTALMTSIAKNTIAQSPVLAGLAKFMDANSIDVVHFESAVKVGGQGKINLSHKDSVRINGEDITYDAMKENLDQQVRNGDITSKQMNDQLTEMFGFTDSDDVAAYLENTIFGGTAEQVARTRENELSEYVHEIPYEDYGIQVSTEEHFLDRDQLLGTQIRKLIMADLSPDATFWIGDKEYTKSQLLDLYNRVITENIIETYEELQKLFSDDAELERVLRQQCKGDSQYSLDLLMACTRHKDGRFNMPLFEMSQARKMQTLLNSIVKKRSIKQKQRGGTLIQVSSFGLHNDLNIIYKRGKEEISYEWYLKKNNLEESPETKEMFNAWANEQMAAGGLSIAYYECYMPAYSREFYEPFLDERGNLDINKMPSELRNCIGYRVPTEAHYSMAPLRIKGFLPQSNGGAIMLPADITTISGSDFDVDKMYVMFPEFKAAKRIDSIALEDAFITRLWNTGEMEEAEKRGFSEATVKRIIRDVTEEIQARERIDDGILSDKAIDEILTRMRNKETITPEEAITNEFEKQFLTFYKLNRNRDTFTKVSVDKIGFDYRTDEDGELLKPVEKQSRLARNNAILDIMRAVLTSDEAADKAMQPGGFDEEKKAARVMTILTGYYDNKEALDEYFKKNNIPFNKKTFADDLNKMSIEELDDIVEVVSSGINPLSPITQAYFHNQNATGGKMIGIYANHNANHALMQLLDNEDFGGLELGEHLEFRLFGHSYNNLSQIYRIVERVDENGQIVREKVYISKTSAGFLAASVDNVKDPVLAALNQNTYTANASMLLARLGYTAYEIGLFFNHPLVKQATEAYLAGGGKGSVVDFTRRFLEENMGIKDLTDASLTAVLDESDVTVEMITADILDNNTDNSNVAYMLYRVMNAGESLNTIVSAMKNDTGKGCVGPTVGDTYHKMQIVEKAEALLNVDNPYMHVVQKGSKEFRLFEKPYDERTVTRDQLRRCCMNSSFPYMNAFYITGLYSAKELLSKHLVQYSPFMQQLIEEATKYSVKGTLSVKTINALIQTYIAVMASRATVFSAKAYNMTQKQYNDYLLNKFPAKLYHTLKKYQHTTAVGTNALLQRLDVKKTKDTANNETDYVITFRNVGKSDSVIEEQVKNDWVSLITSSNDDLRDIGIRLFQYSHLKGGLAFGPDCFGHLASVVLKVLMGDYREALYNFKETADKFVHGESATENKEWFTWFIEQFIHNNVDNYDFLPTITDSVIADEIIDEERKKFKFKIKMPIYDDKTHRYYGQVKGLTDSGKAIFRPFVKIKVGRKEYLYRLRQDDPVQRDGQTKVLYVYSSPLAQSYNDYEEKVPIWAMNSARRDKISIDNINREYDESEEVNYDDLLEPTEKEDETTFDVEKEGSARPLYSNNGVPNYLAAFVKANQASIDQIKKEEEDSTGQTPCKPKSKKMNEQRSNHRTSFDDDDLPF